MIENPAPEHAHAIRRGRTARSLLRVRPRFSTIAALLPLLAVSALVLVGALAGTGAASARSPTPAARAAQLYDTAQRDFADGTVRAGLDELDQAVAVAPANTNVLALRAFWASQQLDYADLDDSLNRLGALDPGKRVAVTNAINAITAAAMTPPDPFPSPQGPRTAIVVLGYGLLPDGSMRPELVERLWAAWLQAVAAPWSPIITTGGNPHNGVTEGQAMAGWLIGHSIPAGRIFPETRADSTVQNALFAARIIHTIGADNAVVVTSADHIRRGAADLVIAGVPVVGATSTANHILGQLLPLSPAQRWGMYVDATKVFGLPATL
jgi:uncharacterized SAM-binding protein YcdF (DUF218 family)